MLVNEKNQFAVGIIIKIFNNIRVEQFKNILYYIINLEMLNVVNIAEKNSVAKQIAKHLSDGSFACGRTLSKYNPIFQFKMQDKRYNMKVSSVRGHIIEYNFPKQYKSWSKYNPRIFMRDIDVIIQPGEDMAELVANLEMLARGAQILVLWLDCDREGEAIAFEVLEIIRKVAPNVQVKRARFSAVTKNDVWNAFRNLVEPNKYQADAVCYRQEVDLRLGVTFTIFQSLTLQNSIGVTGTVSYGPCQFPTLGFVVERYLKVKNFQPEKFWIIKAFYVNQGSKEKVEFKWNRQRLFCQLSANILFLNMIESFPDNSPTAQIVSSNKTNKKKYKPYPLATIELQKLGTKKLNMSSKQVMDIAEKLYQKGHISYPRTETTSYPPTMNMLNFVKMFENGGPYQDYAHKLVSESKYNPPRNGNKNDQAHPPIHPVKSTAKESLTNQEWRVYDLICRHFLGSCSQDAEGEEKIICIEVGPEKFHTTHLEITAYNYLEIYTFDRWTQSTIPNIPNSFTPLLDIVENQTCPPAYLTQAELIGLMDKNQIGTDATIHQHINTIQQREYAIKTNSTLKPTPLGLALVQSYNTLGIELSNCSVRRNIEINMNQIVNRRLNRQDAVRKTINEMMPIYDKLVEKKGDWIKMMRKFLPEANSGENTVFNDSLPCHICSSTLINKNNRLVCQACKYQLEYPSGNYTKTDFKCPICNFTVVEIVKKARRFADNLCLMCYNNPDETKKYLECANCTFQCPKAKGSVRKDLFPCPTCESKMSIRLTKTGRKFVGCNAFPDCRQTRSLKHFVKNIVILNETCEKCEENSMCKVVMNVKDVDDIVLQVNLHEKGEGEDLTLCVNPLCTPAIFQQRGSYHMGNNNNTNFRNNNSNNQSLPSNSRPNTSSIKCFRCQEMGHYATDCPKKGEQQFQKRSQPSVSSNDIMKKWEKNNSENKFKGKKEGKPRARKAGKESIQGQSSKSNQYKKQFQKGKNKNKSEEKAGQVANNNSNNKYGKYTCYACGEVGHISTYCPQRGNSAPSGKEPKGKKQKKNNH